MRFFKNSQNHYKILCGDSMLEKLLKFGQEHYDFCEYKVKDIDKSCCDNEECKVIDFDRVKEKVVSLHSLRTISSCDGLKICCKDQRIDFIEMKGFKEFKTRNEVTSKKIDSQVKKFDFEKKIKDSYFLLQTIINSSNFNVKKEDYRQFENTLKRYFIVTDIQIEQNGIETIAFTLEFLANVSNIDKNIQMCLQNKIDEIEQCFLVEKPKLVGCDEICKLLCESEIENDRN